MTWRDWRENLTFVIFVVVAGVTLEPAVKALLHGRNAPPVFGAHLWGGSTTNDGGYTINDSAVVTKSSGGTDVSGGGADTGHGGTDLSGQADVSEGTGWGGAYEGTGWGGNDEGTGRGGSE